jgi:hypothetical protein
MAEPIEVVNRVLEAPAPHADVLKAYQAFVARRTDEELFLEYACARARSSYARSDAEVANFADDMVERHRARYPK